MGRGHRRRTWPVRRASGSRGRRWAFSPDGKTVASASDDATVLVWNMNALSSPGRQPTFSGSPAELKALCSDLADGDAVKAHRAIGTLVAAADRVVPTLKDLVRVDVKDDTRRVEQPGTACQGQRRSHSRNTTTSLTPRLTARRWDIDRPRCRATWLDYTDQVLTLHFTLPFKTPVKAKELKLEIYDPTIFVDFSWAKEDPAQAGRRAQMQARCRPPREMTFAEGKN